MVTTLVTTLSGCLTLCERINKTRNQSSEENPTAAHNQLGLNETRHAPGRARVRPGREWEGETHPGTGGLGGSEKRREGENVRQRGREREIGNREGERM
ncbi:hypothetical protein PoB_004660100 [Plakobranchus ocellatus]|uniref:Uncharacterized protein n=1 Tax=Plakobranchus ocellatus TaxID=259542 RepID=A0AAV4B9Q1_9GAST|nr:hypothetical protein PoB_004660100 [Plakobranchus ocellatus]